MTARHITDLKTPIGEVIDAARQDGVLIESEGHPTYAVMPLDDELIDYLLEHNARLIGESRQTKERMTRGEFHSHEDVKHMSEE